MAELESLLAAANDSSDAVTPEMRAKGIQLAQQLESSAEGLIWCLDAFSALELPGAKTFVFDCVRYRLREHFEEIAPEQIEQIRELLFVDALESYDDYQLATASVLAAAQAEFASTYYPDPFPGLFPESIMTMAEMPVMRFLAAFCSALVIPPPLRVDSLRQVKGALREQGLHPPILAAIRGGMEKGIPQAFAALTGYARWGDNSWFDDGEVIQVLYAGLERPETAPSALEVITACLDRLYPIELKLAYLETFDIGNVLVQFSQFSPEFGGLHLAAATLMQTAGIAALSVPIAETLFQLAVAFLMNPDSDVAYRVTSFLYLFCLEHPEAAEPAVEAVIHRLAMFYSQSPYPGTGSFPRMLTCVALAAAAGAMEVAVGVIERHAAEVNIAAEPGHASAVLCIVSDFLIQGYAFPSLEAIMGIYSGILEVEPPIPEHSFYLVYGFLKLPLMFRDPDDRCDLSEQLGTFLMAIAKFATCVSPDFPPPWRVTFSELLVQFIARKMRFIAVHPDIINTFLGIGPPDLFTVGGLLMGVVPEQAAALNSLLGTFAEMAGSKPGLVQVLNFLSAVSHTDLDHSADMVIAFIGSVTPNCVNDDQLLAHAITALARCALPGFGPFQTLASGQIPGPHTVMAIAEAAMDYCTFANKHRDEPVVQPLLDLGWVVELISALFQPFAANIETFRTAPATFEGLQTVAFPLIQKCFGLFARAIPALTDAMLDEIDGIAHDLLDRHFALPRVWEGVLNYCIEMVTRKIERAIRAFTAISLNFLFAPAFDPCKQDWGRVIGKVLQFHAKIVSGKRLYNEFAGILTERLQDFGVDPDLSERYVALLEQDTRASTSQAPRMFTDFVIAKNRLTWE
jgi:hypothetical protein